jgi:hypothetical protein
MVACPCQLLSFSRAAEATLRQWWFTPAAPNMSCRQQREEWETSCWVWVGVGCVVRRGRGRMKGLDVGWVWQRGNMTVCEGV